MSINTLSFDQWIRTEFVQINTDLEKLYYQQSDRVNIATVGGDEKIHLQKAGVSLIKALVAEGNNDEGFDTAFNLLGNVGLFMAACRRHEITLPARENSSPLIEASALAMQIGASIGVTPRFATAHLTTHNKSVNGLYKRFTDLTSEKLFLDYNTRGIFAYKRAADALLKILPLGISHPITADLLIVAKQALQDVMDSNKQLSEKLDATEFFFQVRPYYKPHYVGSQIYRGANAGDFAGINVIDLLLGLCFANEPYYAEMLVEKFLYMMPEDQAILRDSMRRANLMDDFLNNSENSSKEWYQVNLRLFLDVCKFHGGTAAQHHHQLVEKYIAKPADNMDRKHLVDLTASGPPLVELLNTLEQLKDRRTAANRADIKTRYKDIQKLKMTLI